jgi:hypothetical protein
VNLNILRLKAGFDGLGKIHVQLKRDLLEHKLNIKRNNQFFHLNVSKRLPNQPPTKEEPESVAGNP